MKNTIHIDEKWFYLTKVKRSYYTGKEEQNPHRTLRSKKPVFCMMVITISKLRMFISADLKMEDSFR